MKKRISTFVWVCILGIVCIFSCIVIYKVEYPTITLRNMVQERLVSQAEENSLLSHFTFRDPKGAGLSGAVRMPVYSKEAYDLSVEKDKEDFEVLRGLDFSHATNRLSKSTLCNALMFSLKHEIALSPPSDCTVPRTRAIPPSKLISESLHSINPTNAQQNGNRVA